MCPCRINGGSYTSFIEKVWNIFFSYKPLLDILFIAKEKARINNYGEASSECDCKPSENKRSIIWKYCFIHNCDWICRQYYVCKLDLVCNDFFPWAFNHALITIPLYLCVNKFTVIIYNTVAQHNIKWIKAKMKQK